MKTLKTKWTGIRPLLMHNGLLADQTNTFTRQIKALVSKGSKKLTVADYELRDALEWEGGLYWDEEMGPVIPSANIERCIQLGAQKSRLGKDFAAGVFCAQPLVKLNYDGPRDAKKLFQNKRFRLSAGVVIQGSRIIRVRPMFPEGWWIEFEVEYDDSLVNEVSVRKAMIDAGSLVGLGDWRPKYGRFEVEGE